MDQLLILRLKKAIQERREYIVDGLQSTAADHFSEFKYNRGILVGLNQALDIAEELYQRNLSDEAD